MQNTSLIVAGGLLVAALLSIWVRRQRLGLHPRISWLGGVAVAAFASFVVVALRTDVIPDEIEPFADYAFIAIGSLATIVMVVHAIWTETDSGHGK